MAIADTINSIRTHLETDYESLENIGAELENVDKNIENIASVVNGIYDTLPKTTGEGTSISLNTLKGKMNIQVKGDTSQDGTPTPSTPIDIEVVTGTQEVKVENAQLIDFSTLGNSNTSSSFNNDILTVSTNSGTYANAYKDITNLYKNNAGKVLRFDFSSISYDVTPNVRIVGIRVISGGTNSNITLVDNNKNISTHTIPNDVSNITQVTLTIYANNTNTVVTNTLTINKPILHFGSTQIAYQPYKEQVQTISLGNIELCKIGTYQDYLYKTSGKNVLELGNGTISNGGLTATITDKKTISMSGTSTAISFCTIISDRLNLEKGTYTLGAFNPIASSDSGMDLRITTTGGSGMLARLYLNVANNTLTFTLNEDLVNGRLIVRTSSGVTLNNFIIKPMLVKGSTIGNYEPYGSGIWYKKENITNIQLTSSMTWNNGGGATGVTRYYSLAIQGNVVTPVNNDTLALGYSNIGMVTATQTYNGSKLGVAIHPNGAIYIDSSIKDSLSSKEVWLYYVLATPNDIQITNTNLIEQLDNLEKLKSYNGVTNISSSGNLSAILSVSALKGE